MKTFVLTFIIILCSVIGYSQTTDTIAIYDPVVRRNFDYPVKADIRYNNPAHDYYAAPQSQTTISYGSLKRDNSIPLQDNLLLKQSTIVVINNKIFSLGDKEFRQLDKSRILEMNIIKDENSLTNIKTIILIKTK